MGLFEMSSPLSRQDPGLLRRRLLEQVILRETHARRLFFPVLADSERSGDIEQLIAELERECPAIHTARKFCIEDLTNGSLVSIAPVSPSFARPAWS